MSSARYEQLDLELEDRALNDETRSEARLPVTRRTFSEKGPKVDGAQMGKGQKKKNGSRFASIWNWTKETFAKIWERVKMVRGTWVWMKGLFDDKPYEVTETWGNTIWYLTKRLLTAGILITFIVLGIVGQTFTITEHSIWQKFQVNQDAQLAAFGLLNTILAIMVRDSLSHIAGTIITRWMVSEEGKGATPLDFEMNEELNKPWIAIANFYTRRKKNGWKSGDMLRFLLCLATGVCLILQGAGINTIGMPKVRWWPDPGPHNPTDDRRYFTSKAMQVSGVNRMSVWGRGSSMVRDGGDVSWDMAHVLGAVSIIGALESLGSTIDEPVGWQPIGDRHAPRFSALLVTSSSNPSYQAVSVDGRETVNLWNEQRKIGKWGQKSIGWSATLKINGILLDAQCHETSGLTPGLWEASSEDNNTVSLAIGPDIALNGEVSGATCSISVKQVLAEMSQWIIKNDLDPDHLEYSINSYGGKPYNDMKDLRESSADADIARELAGWFNDIFPTLQMLFSNKTIGNLTSTAMKLSEAIVKRNRGHTPMDGLSMVVATIFSNFLTTFAWDYEDIEGESIRQGPIQWQLFGSGPRLRWQWAIAIVIGVTVLIQLFDIFLVLCHRQSKGLWLSLGGMMVAANSAEEMPPITGHQGAGFVSDREKFVKFFMRESRSGEDPQTVNATLISEEQLDGSGGKYKQLNRRRAYG